MNRVKMNKMNSELKQWHANEMEVVLLEIRSSMNGLTSADAKKRLLEYGENKITSKKKDGTLILLWRQINNPLIWVLIGSSALATIFGKITDGLVVLTVVIINTIIGFFQEFKAGKAIEALSDMIPEFATVLRDNKISVVPVSEIVPGDIVQLNAGDRVPADMRLIKQKNLSVEEAALTGESLPVQKLVTPVESDAVLGDRKCMVYGGTLVSAGTATAVVVATGMKSELGKISDMLNETTDLETPLTKKLAIIGKYLTIGIIIITILILIIGTIRATGQGVFLGMALKDSLIFAIALAVGAIPEGLPAVVTITLAIGVQRMAKRRAIIRKLPAVETLGSTTVICTDKTGTLTRNEMTVNELWTLQNSLHLTGVGYNPTGVFLLNGIQQLNLSEDILTLLKNAVLCSDASISDTGKDYIIAGDPTEVALIVAAAKAKIDTDKLHKMQYRIDVIPFDSELKYMATLVWKPDNNFIIIKGAPEVIMNKCLEHLSGHPLDKQHIISQIERLGARGMRVLAVAQKDWRKGDNTELLADDVLEGFQFVGLIGMMDPPRIEAIEAIKACHNAGIVVKMITGDHHTTARSIGIDLGLSENGDVVTGLELSKMDDVTLQNTVSDINIFARVAPEHKLQLVRALQKNNQIVAMTGDGVNDAPSLKQSNIGIAMGITGTSVSKEAADIVLADDNFSSISAAVEEGRRIYDNLIKSLAFLLPTNLGLAFILIYAILFFPFNPFSQELLLPMLPTQLLWINLVAGIALALPLAFEVLEPNVMRRPPRNPNEPLFNRFVTFRVFFVSVLMTSGAILLFTWEYSKALSNGISALNALPKSQTIVVTFVIVFQIFYMLNCRSLKDSLLKIGIFSNKTIFIGIGIILALQALFIYNPLMQSVFGTTSLDLRDILLATGAGFLIFPIIWIEKKIHAIF
ncbi:MAG: cation-translocating P-type ATPase [Lentimicrobium sp.]